MSWEGRFWCADVAIVFFVFLFDLGRKERKAEVSMDDSWFEKGYSVTNLL